MKILLTATAVLCTVIGFTNAGSAENFLDNQIKSKYETARPAKASDLGSDGALNGCYQGNTGDGGYSAICFKKASSNGPLLEWQSLIVYRNDALSYSKPLTCAEVNHSVIYGDWSPVIEDANSQGMLYSPLYYITVLRTYAVSEKRYFKLDGNNIYVKTVDNDDNENEEAKYSYSYYYKKLPCSAIDGGDSTGQQQ